MRKMKAKLGLFVALICIRFLLLDLSFAQLTADYAYADGSHTNHQFGSSKILSKASLPTKTILDEDGKLIDCVNIYDQPAFENPLLKHHTIKIISGVNETIPQNSIHQTWHRSGSCPHGTVPISRKQTATKHMHETSKSWTSFHPPAPSASKDDTSSNQNSEAAYEYEYAVASVPAILDYYSGTRGDIDVWKPKVEPNEISHSYIGVARLAVDDGNQYYVTAGWRVSPSEYGDGQPRLTVSRSGSDCAHHCSGFVQTSNKIFVDAPITPVSVEGRPYYRLTFKIKRDDYFNWVVSVEEVVIGYYPHELFPSFDLGDTLYYGGLVISSKNTNQRHTNTEMGSGHFPSEGEDKAAKITDIFSFDHCGGVRIEYEQLQYISEITNPDCYDMKYIGQQTNYGHAIAYGGSGGRNPNCKIRISSAPSLSLNYHMCISLLLVYVCCFCF